MKTVLIIVCLLLCFSIIMFSSASMEGAAHGFELFISNVLPALFPFFTCVSVLKELGLFNCHGKKVSTSILKIFFISCLSGSPTGSFLIESSFGGITPVLSLKRRSILAALCNLASPIFILGTICVNMLHNSRLALLFILSHYGSALILLLICLPTFSRSCLNQYSYSFEDKKLSFAITDAISDASFTMLKLGGTLILFSSLISILGESPFINLLPAQGKPLILGLVEITNGIHLAANSDLPLKTICTVITVILSFGGLCILVQACSTARSSISIYLLTKVIHSTLAGIICFLLYPLFSGSVNPAWNSIDEKLTVSRFFSLGGIALCGFITSCFSSLFSTIVSSKLPKQQSFSDQLKKSM